MALADGRFAVAWEDSSLGVGGAAGDTSGSAIKAQVFTAAGARIGSEILINTATEANQTEPRLTPLANGDFVVTWTDLSQGNGGATGDTGAAAVKARVISIIDNQTPPAITTQAVQDVLENTTLVAALTSADPDPDGTNPAAFRISGGADADLFEIVGGNLAFKAAKDYETAAHGYQVEVTASDGENSSSKTITVNLVDSNDVAPTIVTAASRSVTARTTLVATLDSTDPDTVGVVPATFSITGGADASQFEIAGNTLAFRTAKDFAADPHSYEVQVTASDGANSTSKTITVSLTLGAVIQGTAGNDLVDATHTPADEPLPTAEADTISGLGGHDTLHGLAGDDTINGGAGNDTLYGEEGDDALNGAVGVDTLHGGKGDDFYLLDNVNDVVVELADEGIDLVWSTVSAVLADNVENLDLRSVGNIDGTGNALDNAITGNLGNNTLSGLGGADKLVGAGGNDVLIGGAGRDVSTGGGGADRFVFQAVSDSLWGGARDLIKDFQAGIDKIDLAAIDASTVAGGDQAFTFVGAAAFTRTAGELQVTVFETTNTMVSADVDGNGRADFQILLTGLVTLQASDFLL